MALKLSGDRKVSTYSKFEINNTYPKGRHKVVDFNSFGILAGPPCSGGSCPGATEFCLKCYAINLERAFPSAGRLVTQNLEVLRSCGNSVTKMVDLLDTLMEDYWLQHLKAEQRAGHLLPKLFRIHWDGDFYSKPYTAAWAKVIRNNPGIQFWLYTRSFKMVSLLKDIENLAVYLSVDRFNLEEAKDTKALHPWVLLAFCGDDWTETEKLALEFPEERKGPKCPALTKKLPLVNDAGQGACIACGMCLFGINNVRFSTKH